MAETACLAWWRGAEPPGQALAVAVVSALMLAASALPVPATVTDRADLRAVGGVAAALAVPVSALDPDRLWLALLAVGVGVAVVAVREDHRWGWVSGVLLTASSWVRLAEADVTAPEAYTVPPALLLLAVGWLQRRRQPDAQLLAGVRTGAHAGAGAEPAPGRHRLRSSCDRCCWVWPPSRCSPSA